MFETQNLYLKNTNSNKYHAILFDSFVLLTSVPSKTSILSKYSIYNIKTSILKIMHWIYLTVCYCHVTCAFQSQTTLYSYLNVKDLLARSRKEIWSLSDYNWTRTQNHSVRKRTLNHLANLTRTYTQMHRTDKYSEHGSILKGQFAQMVECPFTN